MDILPNWYYNYVKKKIPPPPPNTYIHMYIQLYLYLTEVEKQCLFSREFTTQAANGDGDEVCRAKLLMRIRPRPKDKRI